MHPGRDHAVLQVLPRLHTGGVEEVVVELTEAVAAAGVRALTASARGRLITALLRAGGQHISMPLDSRDPLRILDNARRLTRLVREEHVSLIHAHSRAPAISALLAARRTKTPFVTTYHGAYSENFPLKRRYNAIMAAGDRVIAISDFVADMVRTRHKVPESRLRVVPGGVDLRRFDPERTSGSAISRIATTWNLPDGAPVILLPARMTSWKGHAVLIDALARMRNREAVAVLVGNTEGKDSYLRTLLARADATGTRERLRFAGDIADMPAAYMVADVAVNASTDPEAFGRTIVEAQAMRRITIASDHGAARETVLHGETGLLVPPGDADTLAEALDWALDLDSATKTAMGDAARAHVTDRYSIEAMQRGNLAVYDELLR